MSSLCSSQRNQTLIVRFEVKGISLCCKRYLMVFILLHFFRNFQCIRPLLTILNYSKFVFNCNAEIIIQSMLLEDNVIRLLYWNRFFRKVRRGNISRTVLVQHQSTILFWSPYNVTSHVFDLCQFLQICRHWRSHGLPVGCRVFFPRVCAPCGFPCYFTCRRQHWPLSTWMAGSGMRHIAAEHCSSDKSDGQRWTDVEKKGSSLLGYLFAISVRHEQTSDQQSWQCQYLFRKRRPPCYKNIPEDLKVWSPGWLSVIL